MYSSHIDEGYVCRVQLISPKSRSYLQKLPWPHHQNEKPNGELRSLNFVTTQICLTDAKNRRHGTRTFAWAEREILEVVEPTVAQPNFYKKLIDLPEGIFILNLIDIDIL